MKSLLKGSGYVTGALVGVLLVTFPSIILGVFSFIVWDKELTFNDLILAFCFATVLLLIQVGIVEKLIFRTKNEGNNNR